jgi:PAS domain S-box-containing protein
MDAVTDGFVRVTGYEFDELQQLGGWPLLIHPEDMQVAEELVTPRRLRGEPGETELRIITKQKQVRWIHFSMNPIWDDAQGRATRLVGAVRDITERKEAEKKLQDYAQRLQSLSRRLLEVQEHERQHLARELHDEIGQLLTGVIYALEGCRRTSPEVAEDLARVQERVKDLTAHVRDLSLRLRPTMLDDFGLVAALVWHLDRFRELTKIQVDFAHDGLEERYVPELETAVYRIVQEGLTNVARHSGVTQAEVRLSREDGRLTLRIADTGKGFDPRESRRPGHSSGLSGMQERVALLDGTFSIQSHPGAGTCLTAEFPIGERKA